jgi:hypothetical protein
MEKKTQKEKKRTKGEPRKQEGRFRVEGATTPLAVAGLLDLSAVEAAPGDFLEVPGREQAAVGRRP